MPVVEVNVQDLILKIAIGEDISESFQVFTDDDCTIGYNYTYHTGTIKMKEDKRHSAVVLEFNSGNGRLSLDSTGNVVLSASRLDNISKLRANGAREYEADLMITNISTNVKTKHANIVFKVTESASI